MKYHEYEKPLFVRKKGYLNVSTDFHASKVKVRINWSTRLSGVRETRTLNILSLNSDRHSVLLLFRLSVTIILASHRIHKSSWSKRVEVQVCVVGLNVTGFSLGLPKTFTSAVTYLGMYVFALFLHLIFLRTGQWSIRIGRID